MLSQRDCLREKEGYAFGQTNPSMEMVFELSYEYNRWFTAEPDIYRQIPG